MSAGKPLTAGELIAALGKLPCDTVIYTDDHDNDYDMWMSWSITGVAASGELTRGDIIASGSLSEDEPDDDLTACSVCDGAHYCCCDCG